MLHRRIGAWVLLAVVAMTSYGYAQDKHPTTGESLGTEQTYSLTNEGGRMATGRMILDGAYKGHVYVTAYQDGQPAATTQPTYGDPYGFTAWLNATRAQYGLRPVGYDPNLANWAAVNNQQQAARGMGHFVMGPARRQNAGVGSYAAVCQGWLMSPAHQAALLDPTITYIGIASAGVYWTFNGF